MKSNCTTILYFTLHHTTLHNIRLLHNTLYFVGLSHTEKNQYCITSLIWVCQVVSHYILKTHDFILLQKKTIHIELRYKGRFRQ